MENKYDSLNIPELIILLNKNRLTMNKLLDTKNKLYIDRDFEVLRKDRNLMIKALSFYISGD